MKLSVVQEDYVKAIWKLSDKQPKVNIKSIADELDVKSSTVASMFTFLSNARLVDYEKNTGAVLTSRGDDIARKLIRKHRLLESFLEDVLKLEGDILHQEAEELEHVISDQLMYYIDAHLNYPDKDPHGEQIPGLIQNEVRFKISELQIGQYFELIKLNLKPDEIAYCKKYNFEIGSKWTLLEKSPTLDSYLLGNKEVRFVLSQAQATNIDVALQT